jgi:predicted aldo/keto reductase-like oxidoreductase
MVTYNPSEAGEREVIDYAQEKNKAVFIKKGLASGHLDKLSKSNPLTNAFDFILSAPGVSSIIVGTLKLEHLKQNVKCVENFFAKNSTRN